MSTYDRAMTLLLSEPDVCDEICKLVLANVKKKISPRPMSLTRNMRDLYEFIRDYSEANSGVAPSYDEMMTYLGLHSKSGVYRLVCALEERGVIRRLPNRARAIVCIEQEILQEVA